VKGIAHFISGIAVATFIPDAVHQAATGSPILALGGLFGLLPDTLDFKLTRYFEVHQDEIDPDPHDIQPQAIAERIAGAMRAAFDSGEPKTIMLHTMRLGADLWREYSLRFSPRTGEVVVRVGPVVNTSQAPLPGSQPAENAEGRASVGVPVVHTYDAETKINIFSGPSFRFERQGGAVRVTFLPWHRRWTHSLTLAAAVGLAMGLLLGAAAGLVSGLGFATHVLEDQLGFMGSNLLWPLTRGRTAGLGLLRSGDGLPNFLTVWLAVALILFNLDRFSAAPRLSVVPYLLAAALLPLLALGTLYWWGQRRGTRPPVEALRQGDILAEVEEVEL
jgi:membrane-bound metal-dependent hydrolase YbcI (DUF457 family)